MEQSPNISRVFHFRMLTVLSTLWLIDGLLVAFAAESILAEGPSVMIMFASEVSRYALRSSKYKLTIR